MNNPVVWFEIYVDDMDRARTFYETIFQCSLTNMDSPEFEYWIFPGNQAEAGASGALTKMEGAKPGMGGTLVYFHSADCLTEQARVEPAGGKVFKEKFSIGEHGFIALCTDTEGNMFGLHSMK